MDAKYLVFNESRETGELRKEQKSNQGDVTSTAVVNFQNTQ